MRIRSISGRISAAACAGSPRARRRAGTRRSAAARRRSEPLRPRASRWTSRARASMAPRPSACRSNSRRAPSSCTRSRSTFREVTITAGSSRAEGQRLAQRGTADRDADRAERAAERSRRDPHHLRRHPERQAARVLSQHGGVGPPSRRHAARSHRRTPRVSQLRRARPQGDVRHLADDRPRPTPPSRTGASSPTRRRPTARHTVKFSTTAKMSTYLVALAVGRFECLETSAESVPIRICATEGKKELGRTALEMAGQILTFYNRYFTIKYPFGKLDVLAVPDFAAGAMENTAAIFYRETDLLVDSKDASLDRAQAHRLGARARDGAPVVRRSRDDAVVGRHLAERRVRHVDGQSRAGRDAARLEHPGGRSPRNADGARPRRPCNRRTPSTRPPTRRRRSTKRSTRSRTRRARRCSGCSRTTSAGTRSGTASTATCRRMRTATARRRTSGTR